MNFADYLAAIEKLLEISSECVSEGRCNYCESIRTALEIIQSRGEAISQIRLVIAREDATSEAIEEIRAFLKTRGDWL